MFHLVDLIPSSSLTLLLIHKRAPYRYTIGITISDNGELHVKIKDGEKIVLIGNEEFIGAVKECNGDLIVKAVISWLDDSQR